ncbi:hypothetical protein [Nocardiopsis sp. NPDC055824]
MPAQTHPCGPLTAPIGTEPDGTPVLWHLTDDQGRPAHGLITGCAGGGAPALLTRIISAATRAGITTWHLDAGARPAPPATWHTGDADEFMHTLDGLVRARLQRRADAEPLLALIDHPGALDAYGATLQAMATVGELVQVGLVLRATSPLRLPRVLREITAQSQYVALGHSTHDASAQDLVAVLPDYTAPVPGPERANERGRGRYGHSGSCRPLTLTAS